MHLCIFSSLISCLGHPIALSRIILWENQLDSASSWIRMHASSLCSDQNISLKGLRMDYYVQTAPSLPSVHTETFLKYGDYSEPANANLLVALLARETRRFEVVEPFILGPWKRPSISCVLIR